MGLANTVSHNNYLTNLTNQQILWTATECNDDHLNYTCSSRATVRPGKTFSYSLLSTGLQLYKNRTVIGKCCSISCLGYCQSLCSICQKNHACLIGPSKSHFSFTPPPKTFSQKIHVFPVHSGEKVRIRGKYYLLLFHISCNITQQLIKNNDILKGHKLTCERK